MNIYRLPLHHHLARLYTILFTFATPSSLAPQAFQTSTMAQSRALRTHRPSIMLIPAHHSGTANTVKTTPFGCSYASPLRTARLVPSGVLAWRRSTTWMHTPWCSAVVTSSWC